MLLKYITLFSGFNFLIFSYILLFKKSPLRKSNIVLGFTFITMMVFCFTMFYLQNACILKSDLLLTYYIPIDYILAMLMGPGIFFYLRMILNQPLSIRNPKIWLHALPALPAIVFAIYFMTLPSTVRVERLLHNFDSLMWQGSVLNGLFYIQMTSYLIVCYRIISKRIKESKYILIENLQFDISWLKTFFTLDLIMMFVTAPVCFYIANDYVNTIIGQTVMNAQFIYIFFKTVWQNGILPVGHMQALQFVSQNTPQLVNEPESPSEPALKLTDEQADCYFERLTTFMEFEKIHLQKGCTIQDLAEKSQIPQHHLSHLLNNHLNKNFFDFINEYRVNTAKEMLVDKSYNQLTIEAIGFECGFGAKTSFNKAFKKITNQTPSEFRISSLGNSK